MAEPFLAEIRVFPYNFAPKGWALCNGQILPISQNTALFSLLGTVYGGDGRTNFALPNLQGMLPMHPGQTQGGTQHVLGETGGAQAVQLIEPQIPQHTHALQLAGEEGTSNTPANEYAAGAPGVSLYKVNPPPGNVVSMNTALLSPMGGGGAHANMMPYVAFNFCIALEGVFPSRP
jgi:microcystin-dependent protein